MIPPIPEVPAEQRATAQGSMRYEDVSQDGRMLLGALPHFMGLAVFQRLLVGDAHARATARAGIAAIVSRLCIEGGGGPLSVRKPVAIEGGYELAHTADARGAVDRLLLHAFAVMTAPVGRTHPPAPPNAGEIIEIGRVFVEHVYTRPFASREQRKVLRFEPGPWPEVPARRVPWRAPQALLVLPPDATPLDHALEPDEVLHAFGLAHTDSNQHVNSLVYPRLFEEALLRRLAAHGLPTVVLARRVEVAYRKPCFAGQRARTSLQLYRRGPALGASGVYVAEGETASRPNAVARMEVEA
jgi:hypothetical protein